MTFDYNRDLDILLMIAERSPDYDETAGQRIDRIRKRLDSMTTKDTHAPASEELLPCPFCGGEAKMHMSGMTGNGVAIRCTKCEASTARTGNWSAAMFVEKWNTRAQMAATQQKWECAARKQGTGGGNDPVDCNWPVCGCDPHADKVINALEESGLLLMPATQPERVETIGLSDAMYTFEDVPMDTPDPRDEQLRLADELANAAYDYIHGCPPIGNLVAAAWRRFCVARDAYLASRPTGKPLAR